MKEIAAGYPQSVYGHSLMSSVISIIVRGKEILVLGRRAPTTFAFVESKGDFESLAWFLVELQKDLSASQGVPETVPPVPCSSQTDDDEDKDDIEDVLEDIKSHPNCSKAWYLKSIKTIEVHSKCKRSTKLRLRASKKRGGVTLEEATSKALAFLQPTKASSSSSALQPQDMSVDNSQQTVQEDLEAFEAGNEDFGGPA